MSLENAPLASFGVRFMVAPRVKVVAIVTTIGAAIASGFVWFYFRRKKRSNEIRDKATKEIGSMPTAARRGMTPSKPSTSSLSAHQRRRGSTSRSTSGSAIGPAMPCHQGVLSSTSSRHLAFAHAGLESLSDSASNFERSVRLLKEFKPAGRMEKELLENLETDLESIRRLYNDLSKLMERLFPEALEEMSAASTLTPMGSQYAIYDSFRPRRTLSVLSDESFVSALDEFTFPEVEAPVREAQITPFKDLELYQAGWRKVQNGEVQYRCLRTEFLRCSSDEDFLAKLFCVREAFAVIMAEPPKRYWIVNTGRDLLAGLLKRAGKEPSQFYKRYDAMLEFVNSVEDWTSIQDELSYRDVKEITFYDVVLDFILMDAFDDLAHPPASIVAVAQNGFLTASFKERYGRGFISHFYDITEQVSPTMAWGFLGTDESLKELCYYFKEQVCNFLCDIFSLDRVRYTKVDELASDIYEVCQCRMIATQQRLTLPSVNSSPPPSPTNHYDSNGHDYDDAEA